MRRYASFSPITGEIWSGMRHYWVCETHGDQPVIQAYYPTPDSLTPCYACPECLKAHFNGAIKDAEVDGVCSCGAEGDKTCELCGVSRCEKCILEVERAYICKDCKREMDDGELGYALA